MSFEKPRIAVTTGDCAGIGPELVLHALASESIAGQVNLSVYGDPDLLDRVSRVCGIPFQRPPVLESHDEPDIPRTGHVIIHRDAPAGELDSVQPGQVQACCGKAAARWIEQATTDVLARRADALVTAPISKAALNRAGIAFPGHTEMLASLCGGCETCMAFFSPQLIIALATIHTSLATVPSRLNTARLVGLAQLLEAACRKSGSGAPRIGMLALNPHAGENGLFGNEERDIIIPAIEQARDLGINISGPIVPDTAFTWLSRPDRPAPYDAFIAMYHDQALIPFKMIAFEHGVNITLGLPIVRTSPDHGTAFDLAWKGKASPASFFEAIQLATRMAASDEAP